MGGWVDCVVSRHALEEMRTVLPQGRMGRERRLAPQGLTRLSSNHPTNKQTNRYNITAQPAPDLGRLLPSFRPEELGACARAPRAIRPYASPVDLPGWEPSPTLTRPANPPTHPNPIHPQTNGHRPDLLASLLRLNPGARLSAAEALDHAYFRTEPRATPPMQLPLPLDGDGGAGAGGDEDGNGG